LIGARRWELVAAVRKGLSPGGRRRTLRPHPQPHSRELPVIAQMPGSRPALLYQSIIFTVSTWPGCLTLGSREPLKRKPSPRFQFQLRFGLHPFDQGLPWVETGHPHRVSARAVPVVSSNREEVRPSHRVSLIFTLLTLLTQLL